MMPKRANNPLALHNNFGALGDLDFAPSPSPTRVRNHSPKKKWRLSATKHTKQTWIVLHFSNGTVEDLRWILINCLYLFRTIAK